MDLHFYKLRLCDSDLILVDDLDREGREREWSPVAQSLLDRRRGAGAERLVVLSKGKNALWLRAFDGRGEEEGALFDAALAATRYLLDSGRVGAERVRLRTGRGELVVDVLDGSSLGLDLGPPLGLPEGTVLDAAGLAARKALITASGERYEVIPLGLRRVPGRRPESTVDMKLEETDPAAIIVFCQGGARAARARITAANRGSRAPAALPVRMIARDELWVQAPRDSRLDTSAAAALALAAAAATGYAEEEALVRLRGGALWIEWAPSGSLYAAARPAYVYRGEFHLEEG